MATFKIKIRKTNSHNNHFAKDPKQASFSQHQFFRVSTYRLEMCSKVSSLCTVSTIPFGNQHLKRKRSSKSLTQSRSLSLYSPVAPSLGPTDNHRSVTVEPILLSIVDSPWHSLGVVLTSDCMFFFFFLSTR